jgi:hypothetical protein
MTNLLFAIAMTIGTATIGKVIGTGATGIMVTATMVIIMIINISQVFIIENSY